MDLSIILPIIETVAKALFFTFGLALPLVAYSTYFERRFSAIIQDRVGPNRVGIPLTLFGFKKDIHFAGLVQPIADGVKGLLKEDFTPSYVRTFYFWMAPALTAIPAFLTLAVIPFGSEITIPFTSYTVNLTIADLNVGPLFVFAIASLSVYGITFAGWASNNKYSFFGGVRSCAQMISYEIALGLSLIPVLMYFGDLNLGNIVMQQVDHGWTLLPHLINEGGFFLWSGDYWAQEGVLTQWLMLFPLGIAFIVFTVSIFAETNRMPFDLPECETELVGGYHTEYSSMKFALFFIGEYMAMIVGSAVIVTLFLGGWSLGFGLDKALLWDHEIGAWKSYAGIIHIGCFMTKIVAFVLFFILIRWTVPRFRYDQLMRLGWVVFFELALINIFIAAIILMWDTEGFTSTAKGISIAGLAVFSILMIWLAKAIDTKRGPHSLPSS
jgi:NADH-quinone oxidoreductase subunit H